MLEKKDARYFGDDKEGFISHANRILDICYDFKTSSPTSGTDDKPFVIDREAIINACRISDNGENLDNVISEFQKAILGQSLNFGSPKFLAHPDNGVSIAAVLGDIARGIMHQNLVSYEYSPAATYVEYELLKTIRGIVGFDTISDTEGHSHDDAGAFSQFVFGEHAQSPREHLSVGQAGGAFVFGGTVANYICLLGAREHLKRKLKKQGKIYDPRKTRVLTKLPYAHYSLRRGAHLLGIGNADLTDEQCYENNLAKDFRIDVGTKDYRMDVCDLERKINATLEAGEDILCVFALAGDSRMVSFDDLRSISKVCEKYDIWLHADGCEGGQCLFSNQQKKLWDGVERVNSLSLDPHKVLMLPYSLSLFLFREISDMALIDINTSLVRLGGSSFGTYTPGMGSKDFASLRLWFMLKHLGWEELEKTIDYRHELAVDAGEIINNTNELRLVNPNISHNAVAFSYYPKNLPRIASDEQLKNINTLNKEIHHRLNSSTPYYVHMMECKDENAILTEERGTITILRMMFGNPNTCSDTVYKCIKRIIEIGDELGPKYGI